MCGNMKIKLTYMKKKIQQSSSLSLFDWIKQIISFKKNWNDFSEEDKKTYNVFMINKFLSMNQDYLDILSNNSGSCGFLVVLIYGKYVFVALGIREQYTIYDFSLSWIFSF